MRFKARTARLAYFAWVRAFFALSPFLPVLCPILPYFTGGLLFIDCFSTLPPALRL
jgi:hypothetical protein